MTARATSINEVIFDATRNILLDNFAPYVKKVTIGSNYDYKGLWMAVKCIYDKF